MKMTMKCVILRCSPASASVCCVACWAGRHVAGHTAAAVWHTAAPPLHAALRAGRAFNYGGGCALKPRAAAPLSFPQLRLVVRCCGGRAAWEKKPLSASVLPTAVESHDWFGYWLAYDAQMMAHGDAGPRGGGRQREEGSRGWPSPVSQPSMASSRLPRGAILSKQVKCNACTPPPAWTVGRPTCMCRAAAPAQAAQATKRLRWQSLFVRTAQPVFREVVLGRRRRHQWPRTGTCLPGGAAAAARY